METLFQKVTQILENARNTVYKTANSEMVHAYWNIGREIVEEEQKGEDRATYGKEIIKQLSVKLSSQDKNMSERNLWYMRQFYGLWPNVNALRSELSWTHYRLLLKVETENARLFYLNEAIEANWSTRTLERQIGNLYYERMLMSKDKTIVKQEAIEKQINLQPKDYIKDPYVLNFLELKDNTSFRERTRTGNYR